MGFRRADGGSITAVTTVTATDTLLVGQGSATRVATMQQVTNAFGFFTQGSASAEIHAIASSLISSQMSAQIAAGDFITSSEASALLSAVASNQISAQVSSQIEAINLSSLVSSQVSSQVSGQVSAQLAAANISAQISAQLSAVVSVPISVQIANQLSATNISSLVSAQVSNQVSAQVSSQIDSYNLSNVVSAQVSTQASVQIAAQLSSFNLSGQVSSQVSTQLLAQTSNIVSVQVANQISAGDFITSSEASAVLQQLVSAAGLGITQASVCTLVCGMLSAYPTSNGISATYLTKASSSAFLKSADVCAMTCVALSGYITSNNASATYLTKTSSSTFIASACAAAIFGGKEHFLAGFIDTPTARSYPIIGRSPRNYLLTSCAAKTESGILYFSFIVSGVTATPVSNSVGSAQVTFDVCATISAGTRVLIHITSASASAFEWTAVLREI